MLDFSKPDREGFWHYRTCYEILEHRSPFREETLPPFDFYADWMQLVGHDNGCRIQAYCELAWIAEKRPFFRVWPALSPYLASLKDDRITGSMVNLPYSAIGIFFHKKDKSLLLGKRSLRSMVVTTSEQDYGTGLFFCLDFGEQSSGIPVISWIGLPLKPDELVVETIKRVTVQQTNFNIGEEPMSIELCRAIFRAAIGLILLFQGKDESLMQPALKKEAVWSKGRGKPKLLKPEERYERGWDVGKEFVVQPHWRNPSPLALYWTGKGRKIPVYRYRRGTVVHRKKIKIERDQN